jgi:hypothetical protein
MKKIVCLNAICFTFFILFTYTGLAKLAMYNVFVWDLGRDPMISPSVASVMGIALPLIEIGVAILVIIPKAWKWGLYSSLVLMVVFTIYVGWMIHSPVRHCTCGGVLREMTWRQHLWFNVGFTLLATIGILIYNKAQKNPGGNRSFLQ